MHISSLSSKLVEEKNDVNDLLSIPISLHKI